MDVFASDFSLDAALEKDAEGTKNAIMKVLEEQVQMVDATIAKGLSPADFEKAKNYRVTLMTACSIVAIRYANLLKQK